MLAATSPTLAESFQDVLNPRYGTVFCQRHHHLTHTNSTQKSGREIVQSWRLKHWPKNHTSTVTLTMDAGTSTTKLRLVQHGVPQEEKDSVLQNWTNYYWNSMKQAFGWGSAPW